MKKKDITQKTIEAYNDIFADIVNVLLFSGEEIVKEDELTEATTFSQYKLSGNVRGQDRDVAKYWRNGQIRIALVGMENQTEIDADMPLRVISYDGAAYRDQLSKSTKAAVRYPVVTMVLYFGYKERWDKYRTLFSRLDIPAEIRPFVNDYKLNVFEIAYLNRGTIDSFKSDFKILADYCYQMRTTGDYIPLADTLKHPREVIEAMSAFTNDSRYEEAYDEIMKEMKGGTVNMCEYLDRLLARGEASGIRKGRMEGLKAGRIEAIQRLSVKLSDEEIKEFGYTDEEIKEAKNAQ